METLLKNIRTENDGKYQDRTRMLGYLQIEFCCWEVLSDNFFEQLKLQGRRLGDGLDGAVRRRPAGRAHASEGGEGE